MTLNDAEGSRRGVTTRALSDVVRRVLAAEVGSPGERMKVIGIALAALLVAGCATGKKPPASPPTSTEAATATALASPLELPKPSVQPTTAPVASPTPTAPPTAPPDLPRIAATEVDGIRVRIELERNPLPAGEPSWVKVSVTNRGRSNVTWLHDGCASPANVGGQSAAAWPMGREQSANDEVFKAYALGGSMVEEPGPFAHIGFVPENFLGKGSYGCADLGIGETLQPGESRRQTRWWSGFEGQNRSLPPAGPVELSVYAGSYWRGKEPDDLADSAIRFRVPAWIDVADQITRLSPAEVVDAALDDPAFSSYLETQDIGNGREAIAWYKPGTDLWEVGLLIWHDYETPRIRGVQVDPVNGAILDPLDRAWDQDVDGFP